MSLSQVIAPVTSHIINDVCVCGEKISVEINCQQRVSRSDKKRPFYPDSKLPNKIDPTKYNPRSISVFRCRGCGEPVSETVPAAKYE